MKKYKGCLLALALSMGLTGCSQMSEADRVLEEQRQIEENARNEQEEKIPENEDTVASVEVTPGQRQSLYLWEEGNMPAETEYKENSGNYADDPDFRPYIVYHPVPFQSFVVNYRLRPYTQEEGALDLARAVRFVRSHAKEYGIEESDIAVMGFSAGGILSGEELLNYDGLVSPTGLDESYVPDALDEVSADASACGMIYAFYGRLSVASTDVEAFREANLPPTYFLYGSEDPFVDQFETCVAALREAGVTVESHELRGMPHGFGAGGDWIGGYAEWLEEIFEGEQS